MEYVCLQKFFCLVWWKNFVQETKVQFLYIQLCGHAVNKNNELPKNYWNYHKIAGTVIIQTAFGTDIFLMNLYYFYDSYFDLSP